jgi:hypothetical protein
MMRLIVLILSCGLFCFVQDADAQAHKRKHSAEKKKTASTAIGDITACPDEGSGGDPNLNRRKNIRADNQIATVRTLQWMKDLPDPKNFTRQSTNRGELTRLGEGEKIAVAAYALVARKGSKESCNCGLSAPKDTDNHIVLVDPALKAPSLDNDEDESETAEFTPRVRLTHPGLSRARLQPLIAAHQKLAVRVTGLLMFDSEHFLGRHLTRHNNWEIHPVLKLEYCPIGKVCQDTSDANWKNLEKQTQ